MQYTIKQHLAQQLILEDAQPGISAAVTTTPTFSMPIATASSSSANSSTLMASPQDASGFEQLLEALERKVREYEQTCAILEAFVSAESLAPTQAMQVQ